MQADKSRNKGKAGGSGTSAGAANKLAEKPADKAVDVPGIANASGGTSGFSLRRLFDPSAGLPAERTRPWWGFGDVIAWFLVAQVLNLVFSLMVASWAGYALDRPTGIGSRMGELLGRVTTDQAPTTTKTWADVPLWLSQGVLLLPLWACFIGGSIFATVRKGFGPVKDLKIAIRWIDVPIGLAVGLVSQLIITPLLYRFLFIFTGEQDVSAGARGITDKATSPLLVILVFVTVGFVAPIAEEIFFRGLALQSLVRRFGPLGGILLSSAFFAVAHTNPLYFVALMPFAMVLAWMVLRFDRLGPAFTAHIAFNLVTATLLVFGWEAPW
jgi:membrane protease YdiL (CAAX protease family)